MSSRCRSLAFTLSRNWLLKPGKRSAQSADCAQPGLMDNRNNKMKTGNTIGILLLAIALLGMAPAIGMADHHEEVSNPDLKCLKCHSKNLKKKLENGEKMSLRIEVEKFGTSVHKVIGCTGCHRDVAKGKHPSRQPIASRRAYSLKHNQTCRQCHSAKYKAYDGSIHASLVEAGNGDAPLCSDCHSSHAIQPRTEYEPVHG